MAAFTSKFRDRGNPKSEWLAKKTVKTWLDAQRHLALSQHFPFVILSIAIADPERHSFQPLTA
jgi:hypothetical protein